MNYGYVKSVIDGSEHILEVPETLPLPTSYSYVPNMSKVLDQGSQPICVTCSCSAIINWRINLINGINNDHKVKLYDIYNARSNKKTDGMTFKEALHFLRHEGVRTDKGVIKINEYAMITNELALKYALVMNGPCLAGLPVYNTPRDDFWNGKDFQGGHAICIVGYDEDGFIIRNSWGTSWANKGYVHMNYKDFGKFMEIWTIL